MKNSILIKRVVWVVIQMFLLQQSGNLYAATKKAPARIRPQAAVATKTVAATKPAVAPSSAAMIQMKPGLVQSSTTALMGMPMAPVNAGAAPQSNQNASAAAQQPFPPAANYVTTANRQINAATTRSVIIGTPDLEKTRHADDGTISMGLFFDGNTSAGPQEGDYIVVKKTPSDSGSRLSCAFKPNYTTIMDCKGAVQGLAEETSYSLTFIAFDKNGNQIGKKENVALKTYRNINVKYTVSGSSVSVRVDMKKINPGDVFILRNGGSTDPAVSPRFSCQTQSNGVICTATLNLSPGSNPYRLSVLGVNNGNVVAVTQRDEIINPPPPPPAETRILTATASSINLSYGTLTMTVKVTMDQYKSGDRIDITTSWGRWTAIDEKQCGFRNGIYTCITTITAYPVSPNQKASLDITAYNPPSTGFQKKLGRTKLDFVTPRS